MRNWECIVGGIEGVGRKVGRKQAKGKSDGKQCKIPGFETCNACMHRGDRKAKGHI